MPRVLIVTPEPIGAKMAGPAVRASHIARVLGHSNDVVLASLEGEGSSPITTQEVVDPGTIDVTAFDAAIVQGSALLRLPELAASELPIVVDWFDPFHLEAQHRGGGDSVRRRDLIEGARQTLAQQATRGDFFVCSNEAQRAHWLGWLAHAGRINAVTTDADPSMRALLDLASFGTTPESAKGTSPLRDAFAEIDPEDPVLLWAGGMHDWLDPVTVVNAMPSLLERHPDARLVFMAGPHPNTSVEEMGVRGAAIERSRELKLFGTHVLFATTWADYDDRLDWFADADIGVLAHPHHLETALSHRTRLLDHLTAGLATVSTSGDPLSAQLSAAGAAALVDPGDDVAFADAVSDLLGDADRMGQMRQTAAALAGQLRWETTLAPLVRWMEAPAMAADRAAGVVPTATELPAVVTATTRVMERAKMHLDDGGPKQLLERAVGAGRRRLKQ
ncbi:MAG: glycosyltransferase [Acidimicrobiales bacterium]|nr:MAG: glycosyltransferase [Acidimicrobiales bacterium]